jgi:hypothetical protein
MAQPVLAYGTTSLILPWPDGEIESSESEEVLGGQRRSSGGYLRSWEVARWRVYRMGFAYRARSIWVATRDLSLLALADDAFPTFYWPGGPFDGPSGAPVAVQIELGEYKPLPGPDLGSWELTLIEAEPRT